MKDAIKHFFDEVEGAWSVIPAYVKVFLYSASSSIFGLWVAGNMDWRAVIIIIATNLGIYGVPRVANHEVKKM